MKRKANNNHLEKMWQTSYRLRGHRGGTALVGTCTDRSSLTQVICAVVVMLVLADRLEGFVVCLLLMMVSSFCKKAVTDSDVLLCMEELCGDY